MRVPVLTVVLCLFLGLSSALAQRRPDVSGTGAAVVAGHPLAAAAGADVLRRGGNAVDAAITMAGVLAVVRPHMNGVGGDAFLLIREAATGRVHALNGSGRAGSLATLEAFRARGLESIPSTGILSVSVPGAVRAWADALERFGTISLAEALAPGIRYAEEGFPVSSILAQDLSGRRRYQEDPALGAVFMAGGGTPEAGDVLKETDLAETLRTIAARGPDALYGGPIGERIARFMEEEGGLLTLEDLTRHTSTWTEPIWTEYAGYRVGAFSPNTQGLAMLMQMNMASHFDLGAMDHNSAHYVRTLAQITGVAFAERDAHVADPAFAEVPVERLLSHAYTQELVAAIRGGAPRTTPEPRDGDGDTVYLCAVDADGNVVSMIQSLFSAFGSGRMVPGTGIILHNRGSLYELDPSHPNVLAPGKRPYHTLAPAMALYPDGSPFMVFGTPGGDGQTQTLTQIFNNVVLFGMTPQEAVEAPRWRYYGGEGAGRINLEPGFADEVREALEAAGFQVTSSDFTNGHGGAQMIVMGPGPRLVRTGADFRREAYAIAW